MAKSKRMLLLEAASEIIVEQGISRLTLEEVAAQAGVSKGGLLYHFTSKDELIKGLNEETIREFRELLHQELGETGSYTKSYLLATLRQLEGYGPYNASSSMLAAIATNMELIQLWDEDYQQFRIEMAKEGLPLEVGLIVRLVADGFLYSRLFNSDPLSQEEGRKVIQYLLDLIDKEKEK